MAPADRVLSSMVLAAAVSAALASPVGAEGIRSPIPISSRARLDVQVMTAAATAPWGWDAQSRSPLDGSRFMADLTAGDDHAGTFYLKGAASWQDADDALGRVAFTIEQGEYLFQRLGEPGALSARLFGDERRYFTGELGIVLMEDDVVERIEQRLGAIVQATRGSAGADYLVSSLDQGSESDLLQRAAARVSSVHAHAAFAYQHNNREMGEDHAVVQAEAAAYYRMLTGILSYAQSGFGNGFFFPSGSFDTDTAGGSGYSAAAPENSATSAEARLRRLALDDLRFDVTYRYETVGAHYINALAATRPGTVSNQAGVYASHRRYALDGRLVWRDEVRSVLDDSRRRSLEASARAFLSDNSQMLLRATAQRSEFHGSEEADAGFVQAGYCRELQGFMGGVQAMLDGIGQDVSVRAGVDVRVNWNPTSAFYARWILSDEPGRADAVYARLEFRPTGRTWVTLAYGWIDVGDAPFMLDDRDAMPAQETRDVVTVTVRGDF